MKIESLHFNNLNSLYGEWKIDFTHPDYAQNGIFALIGPTGAGKSTILDAICLALYGKTPRLEMITKSTNEIMSRQAGTCFSEIVFQSQGERYTCRWEQRKAKKQASGILQNPSYEISNTNTGEIISSSRSGVLSVVEEKTGMNYDRFTRTILLAQGNFNAFLKAKVEEKSSILEEITGTEIYTEISCLVHEKLRESKEALALLSAQTAHITLLSEEDIKEREDCVNILTSQDVCIQKEITHIQIQKEWLNNLAVLFQELDTLKENQETHLIKVQAFALEKERLTVAKKASELDLIFTELKALRAEQEEDIRQIALQKKQEPERERALAVSTELSAQVSKDLQKIKENIKKNAPLFQELRLLDQSILMQKENIFKKQLVFKEEEQSLQKLLDKQRNIIKNHEKISKNREELNTWRAANKHDEILVSGFGAINEQLKNLTLIQKEGALERKAEQELKKQLEVEIKSEEVLRKVVLGEKNESDALEKEINTKKKEVSKLLANKLLREYQTEKENLLREKALIVRIESLEEERKLLIDERPCPLCGSLHHPYALGNIPQSSTIEVKIKDLGDRIDTIVTFEKEIALLEARAQNLIVQHIKSQNSLEKSQENKEKLQKEHAEFLENIEKRILLYHEKKQEIISIIAPLGFINIANTGIEEVQEVLHKRLLVWQEKDKELLAFEKQTQEYVVELASLSSLIKSCTEKQKEQKEALCIEEKQLEEKCLHRQKLFADKSVDIEEKELQTSLTNLEKSLQKEQITHDFNKSALESLRTKLKTIQEQIARRLPSIAGKEKEFVRAFMEKDFFSFPYVMQNLQVVCTQVQEDMRILQDADREILSLPEKELADYVACNDINILSAEGVSVRGFFENVFFANMPASFVDLGQYVFCEKLYKSVALTLEIRNSLEKEAMDLENLGKEIEVSKKDRAEKLQRAFEKKSYPLEKANSEALAHHIEMIAQELKQKELLLKENTEKLITLRQEIKQNDELKLILASSLEQIELQKKEVTRYERLHSLIGSADGKKYRNFAQGLTFEIMISHANTQLAKMSDRYLLLHDTNTALKLNVIDHYQNGEIRSTQNLSGGESFIVSLALALGLSQMVSQKVRVDSLFLDEGFGTLDEESLEIALETLANIQEENKLIGIISHIPALKERIPVQIELIPSLTGKSVLSGVGCECISRN